MSRPSTVSAETKAEICRAWTGTAETAEAIAARLGLTKSQVIGICHRAGWERDVSLLPEATQNQLAGREGFETMEDRFRRYEAKFERALAENVGVGHITTAEEPKKHPRQFDHRHRAP